MKKLKILEEIKNNYHFYDKDVLEFFEELIVNELEEIIKEQKQDLKTMVETTKRNNIDLDLIKKKMLYK